MLVIYILEENIEVEVKWFLNFVIMLVLISNVVKVFKL